MAVNIGLGYEAQLVGQVLQQRLIGAASWTTVDSPVTAAKYRLDSGGTIVRLHYIGPWSMSGATVIGPTGNTTSAANFVANRSGSADAWNIEAASSPGIIPMPSLTFNPIVSISPPATFAVLDPNALVNDGGTKIGAIRLALGAGAGALGIQVGAATSLVFSGTIGTITYLYEGTKRLLSLTDNTGGQTATGADFTQVLRMVAYDRTAVSEGSSQTVCVSLGIPLYSTETGHYYEFNGALTDWPAAKISAESKNFFGLAGYLANVTSALKNGVLLDRFAGSGWVGGSSAETSGVGRIWRWAGGPEINAIFWNGNTGGSAPVGQYANWNTGEPNNEGQEASTTNVEPYVRVTGSLLRWNDVGGSQSGAYIEYSTLSGIGDDGLTGTRELFTITIQSPTIAALTQSITPIQVSIVNGAVTDVAGVALPGITIGPGNLMHLQVSIDLGTSNSGKRRQPQGFRIVGGSERELISTRSRVGEVYTFVFLKTVDGSSSVNLVLN